MAKILWLSHFLPYPPKGGSYQRSYHLLRQLAHEQEVHYLGLHRPDRVDSSLLGEAKRELSQFCRSFESVPMRGQGQLARLLLAGAAVAKGLPPSTGRLLDPAFHRRIGELVGSCEVVHCDTFELVPFASASGTLTRSRRRTKFVAHFHNVESEIAARTIDRVHGLRRMVWNVERGFLKRLERSVVRAADLVVGVTSRDVEHLERLGAKRTAVVENGVDAKDHFFNPRESARPTVTWIGGMDWFPNADAVGHFLRDIWPEIRREVPGSRAIIVGRPPKQGWGGANHADVEFTGFVNDARPYFWETHVLVVPIRIGGGSRLKILDALATGAPVVSTGIGAEGLAVRDGVHYLRADTVSDFTRATVNLLKEKSLRDRLRAEGRRLVESRYEWDRIGRELSNAYHALSVGEEVSEAEERRATSVDQRGQS